MSGADGFVPRKVNIADWGRPGWSPETIATDPAWRGEIPGEALGTDVTVLFYATDKVGDGPAYHVHPYGEIFIVREGRARFFIGDTVVEAGPGDVLFGPADVPHTFRNLGPSRLATTDIHLSPRRIQTNLDAPPGLDLSVSPAVPADTAV
ncbi:cupin domain-containing protein [Acuticoccus sediminis]|uniref:Cupin domain-containing protein n=1 Tax=Acuticoccus sediminis TaxID=2184697 RepID=A0A8B2NPQ6_9HYPH|nr:cupin domain-containing protein [Acuticoccus sediminis]RAH99967.1 cupin domain-containing protein [Acuticoccus sediminis]